MTARGRATDARREADTLAPRGADDRLLSALTLSAVVGCAVLSSFLARNQSQAVDLAAVWAGLAGVFAVAWAARASRQVRVAGRVALAGAGWLGWALACAVASGRGWSAFMGEPTNLLGWGVAVAAGGVAFAGALHAEGVSALLRRYAWWFVAAESMLAAGQLLAKSTTAGTLPNSTYFGEALLLVLPWVLPAEKTVDEWERCARWGTAVGAVLVLGASGSRVAAAVGLVWLVWAMLSRLEGGRRWLAAASLAIGVLAVSLLFARGEVLGTLGTATLGARPAMWSEAARAVAMRPVLGWGPDGFVAGGAAASSARLVRTSSQLVFRPGATDPHDALVWVAVSTGVPGLALLLWFVVEVGLAARKRWRAGGGSEAAWAVFGCAVVLLTAPTALQVVPMLALSLGVSAGGESPRRDGGGGRRVALTLGLAAVALVSALVAANTATRAGFEEPTSATTPATARAAVAASGIWSFDAHLAYLASMNAGFAASADPSVVAGRVDLVAIERAVKLDTRNPFYALEYARTLKYYREPARLVDAAFAETLARYPAYPLAHAEYAAYLAEQGRFPEARKQVVMASVVDDADQERLAAIAAAKKLISASGE